MTLPINHLIRTLDRCCGDYEILAHTDSTREPFEATVEHLQTGNVYRCSKRKDHNWTASDAHSEFLINRLNGLARDDSGTMLTDAGEWDVIEDPPPEFVIQEGDEWTYLDKTNWVPCTVSIGKTVGIGFVDINIKIRRRRKPAPLPADFDCVPEASDEPLKEGDWVVCVDAEGCSGINVGDVLQVKDFDSCNDPGFDLPRGRSFYLTHRFRRADPTRYRLNLQQIAIALRGGGILPAIQLRGHHPNCKDFNYCEQVEHAREIIQSLVDAMQRWAADEDGIHPDAWEAYGKAKHVLMQPVNESPDEIPQPVEQAQPVFDSWDEPTPGQIADACMSFNHGYGLLKKEDAKLLESTARQWLHAWRKVFKEPSYIQQQSNPPATPDSSPLREGACVYHDPCECPNRAFQECCPHRLKVPAPSEPTTEQLTDEQVSAELKSAGIDMQPAFERLHKMFDEHKQKQPDADGWIECHGGEMPVDGEQLVSRRCLDVSIPSGPYLASSLRWTHVGNRYDITHYRLVQQANELCKAFGARTSEPTAEPDADGWIEWHGGDDPVSPQALVLVRWRKGHETTEPQPAGIYSWHHCDDYNDIVAYRLVQPAPKYRPFASADEFLGGMMAASLEKCIVYAVSRTSVDDGHRGTIAWFSMASEASKFCEKLRQEVCPFPGLTPDPTFHEFEAWVEKDQYGSWNYYVPANGVFDELPVDRELHRESGLRKLTLKERKALGV